MWIFIKLVVKIIRLHNFQLKFYYMCVEGEGGADGPPATSWKYPPPVF